MVAAAVIIAASGWHMVRQSQLEVFSRAMRLGLVVMLLGGIATAVTGDVQARIMESQQPARGRADNTPESYRASARRAQPRIRWRIAGRAPRAYQALTAAATIAPLR